jgi:hypothetical protein
MTSLEDSLIQKITMITVYNNQVGMIVTEANLEDLRQFVRAYIKGIEQHFIDKYGIILPDQTEVFDLLRGDNP